MTKFRLVVLRFFASVFAMFATIFCSINARRSKFLGNDLARDLHPDEAFSHEYFRARKSLSIERTYNRPLWWLSHSFQLCIRSSTEQGCRRLGPIEWSTLKIKDAYDPHMLKIVRTLKQDRFHVQAVGCCVYRDLSSGFIYGLDELGTHGPFYNINQVAKSLLARRASLGQSSTGWILYNRHLDIVHLDRGLPEAYWICSDYSQAERSARQSQELVHAKLEPKTPQA